MKRAISIILVSIMLLAMMPVVSFAADEVSEAITFVSNSSARVDVNAITAYTHASTSGNWMFFDWSGDWLEKTIRKTGEGDANRLRLRAGPATGAACKSWLALMIDFKNEDLTPGVYSLSMSYNRDQSYPTTGTGTEKATFWFAKADSTTSAADYKTEANLLGTVTSFSGSNVLGEDIIIDDLDSEYVLVMEFESDIRLNITNFTFTRTGDIPTGGDTPEVELATEETFTFENASDGKYIYNELYADYGDTNPNWAYFDRSDDYKSETFVESTTGYGIGGLLRNRTSSTADEYALRIKDGTASADAWVALKLKSTNPLKTGKYSLTFDLKNVYEGFNGNTRQAAVYLAKYVEDEDSGSYYKTTENCIRSLERIYAGDEVSIGSFYVEDSSAEYVLIIEIEGAELYLQDFIIKWEEDLPVVELATEETFAFVNSTSSDINMEKYQEYAPTGDNPNWKHFTTQDTWWNAGTDGTSAMHKVRKYNASSYTNSFGIRVATDTGAAWTSLKLDPVSNLEPGVYTLSMTTKNAYQYPQNSDEETRHATFWFAKADDVKQSGADYKTAANLVRTATGDELKNANNKTFKLGEVTITDADAEYVLVIELQGMELYISDFTLTKTGDLLSGDVSLYVYSLVNGVAGTSGISTESAITLGKVESVARGTEITLAASEIDATKEFSHWQTASGTFLSDEDTYTFTANTNIAIVGVYENVADAAEGTNVTVSFYDGFGGRLAQVTKATVTAFSEFAAGVTNTGYRGYIFSFWKGVDGDLTNAQIKKNTIAVAQYTDTPDTYTVTVGGEKKGDYAYNAEVTVTYEPETSEDENFSYWTRNEKIVSYNATYTFNVWGDTDLVAVTGETVTAAPAVVLEKDETDGSYMVEYSLPEGYTFVETGIVFSENGTPSVGSYYSKASSKTLSGLHGQFTAKPSGDETVARGYVIYKNSNGELVASYAD